MAGTEFSPDSRRAGPGRRVGSGPGPMQRRSDKARQQAGRQASTGQGRSAAARAQGSDAPQLGHPNYGQTSEQPERSTGDFRHVQLLAQHMNMRALGRESPFGVWAGLSGEGRQMQQPGQVPFDVLEDGPE